MSVSQPVTDECEDVTEAFEFLDLTNEDQKELQSHLDYMKQNATTNESHKPYYQKATVLLKSIYDRARCTSTQVVPLNMMTDLIDTMREYQKKLMYRDKPPRIALIGETGVGKSTFGNILLEGDGDDDRFWTSPSSDSCTQALNEQKGHWFRDRKLNEITVIDTPGLNDSKISDEERIVAAIDGLKKTAYITAFVLVFNGAVPRFTEAHKQMIHVYRSVFGINLFTNMVIVFTNWPMDATAKAAREVSKQSEESKRDEYNAKFSELFGTEHKIPCFFVESISYKYKLPEWEEVENQFKRFKNFTENMVPYLTVEVEGLKKTNQSTDLCLAEVVECAESVPLKDQDEELRNLIVQGKAVLKSRENEVVNHCSSLILPTSTNLTIMEAEASLKEQEKREESKSWFSRLVGWVKSNPGKLVLGIGAVLSAVIAIIKS